MTKLFLITVCLIWPFLFIQTTAQENLHLSLDHPKIFENDQFLFEVKGGCGGKVLAFHLPVKGWFICTLQSVPGYDSQRIGQLQDNEIWFQLDNRKYKIITVKAISAQAQMVDLWVTKITPPADENHVDLQTISCGSDFDYWFKTTVEKKKNNKSQKAT